MLVGQSEARELRRGVWRSFWDRLLLFLLVALEELLLKDGGELALVLPRFSLLRLATLTHWLRARSGARSARSLLSSRKPCTHFNYYEPVQA